MTDQENEIVHIQELISIRRKNLERMELQAAQYGPLDVPLRLSNGINAERKAISKLQEKLGLRSGTTRTISLPESTTRKVHRRIHPLFRDIAAYFVNRSVKVQQVVELLMQHRLITIIGLAGMGKTSLALAVGHSLLENKRFEDGLFFVRLEGARTADLLIAELSTAIGFKKVLNLDYLAEEIAHRNILIVLDNIETPLQNDREGVRWTMEQLLYLTVRPVFLCTGREFLGLRSERLVRLDKLGKLEAHQLFQQEVMRVAYSLLANEDQAVTALLEEFDGHPLAITLTASLLASNSMLVTELLHRWRKEKESPLQLLDLSPKEQKRLTSFERSLDLSYIFLPTLDAGDVQPRELFATIGLFPGGVKRQTLDDLFPEYSVHRAIGELARRSLVSRDHSRFRMHPLVREYARTQCNDDWYAGMMTNISRYLLKLAQNQGQRLGGPDGNLALHELSEEHPNLNVCLEWAGQQQDASQWLRDFSLALGPFYDYRGSLKEGIAVLQQGLKACRDLDDMRSAARCLQLLGNLHWNGAYYKEARQMYLEAKEIYACMDDCQAVAECLYNLGHMYWMIADYNKARESFEQAQSLFEGISHRTGVADCIHGIGEILRMRRLHDNAIQLYEQARIIYKEGNDLHGEANCLKGIADVNRMSGRGTTANEYYQEAIKLYSKTGDMRRKANCARGLGDIALLDRDYEKAKGLYQDALDTYVDMVNVHGIANSTQSIGKVFHAIGDFEKAKTHYTRAQQLYTRIGDQLGYAHSIRYFADLLSEHDQLNDALDCYQKAIKTYETVENLASLALSLHSAAKTALRLSLYKDAQCFVQKAIVAFEKLGEHQQIEECKDTLERLDKLDRHPYDNLIPQ